MTPEQEAEYLRRLALGKSTDPGVDADNRVFLRGWNAAIEFAIEQMKAVLK